MPRFGRHNKDTYSWELENSNTKHGVGILVNKKWRNVATGQITSANGHINVDHSQQTTCSIDECFLHPLEVCGPPRWKSVQINRESHEIQQEEHPNYGRRFQRWIGARVWCRTCQCRTAHTQRGKQERRLDEAMADDRECRSSWHDVLKKRLKSNLHTRHRKV